MSFIPQVLTKYDPNNSSTNITSNFNGTITSTTGYNSLLVSIIGSSSEGTLTINYGSTSSSTSLVSVYTDTVFANINFTKCYPITNAYYKIVYTGTNGSISTVLSTQLYNQQINSVGTFTNDTENLYDAFGKLRVSNPYTLLDIRVPGQSTGTTGFLQNNIQICSNFSGTGGATGSKTCSNSTTTINISGQGTFTNQSREYCVYQPGKSLLFMASGIMNAASNTSTVKSRIGLFDDNNALYFEYDSTSTLSICIKNNGTVTTSVPNTSWNIDKMDGSGPSGLTLNYTTAQLFVIDMEWLGVGRIRYGFYAFGKIHYCHQVTNINMLTSGPYTTNINLPIRYQLAGSDGGSTGSMIQMCSTVISEGGYSPIGRTFTANNGSTALTITTTETPILLLKGGNSNGNYYHQSIQPLSTTICATGANDILLYRIRLYYAPDSPGNVTWTDVDVDSVAQYSTSITSFTTTNSNIVNSGYFTGKISNNFNLSDKFNNIIQITSNISNISDILVLTVQTVSGTSTGYASIDWQEIY